MLGGVLAGTVVYIVKKCTKFVAMNEKEIAIERGGNRSIIIAMMFGEYFPHPAMYNHSDPENLNITDCMTTKSSAWPLKCGPWEFKHL